VSVSKYDTLLFARAPTRIPTHEASLSPFNEIRATRIVSRDRPRTHSRPRHQTGPFQVSQRWECWDNFLPVPPLHTSLYLICNFTCHFYTRLQYNFILYHCKCKVLNSRTMLIVVLFVCLMYSPTAKSNSLSKTRSNIFFFLIPREKLLSKSTGSPGFTWRPS